MKEQCLLLRKKLIFRFLQRFVFFTLVLEIVKDPLQSCMVRFRMLCVPGINMF